MRSASLRLLLGVLALVAIAFVTVAAIAPPAARGTDAPVTEFSAARALTHIEAIAKTPHPVGSPAHDEVRAYLVATLKALGLEVQVEDKTVALKAAAVTHGAHVMNVIARLPGTQARARTPGEPPAPAVMLAAHYDSVAGGRGASDDGSGVATLLETARALSVSPRMQNEVLFLFSDAEEVAACGSFAFTSEELAKQPIAVALNFEARGTRGAVALYDTSEANGALIHAVAAAAPRVISNSLLGSLARTLPNDSDATVFKRAGIPTYAFAYVDHFFQYHQYTDSTDALDPRSLQHDGDYALPLARYLGDTPLPLPASSSFAYFDVFGRTVIAYPSFVARALAIFTLGLLGVLVWQRGRDAKLSVGRVVVGSLLGILALVIAALAAGLVHVALRTALDPFVLLVHPAIAAIAGATLGIALVLLGALRALRRETVANAVFGVLGLWAMALLLTTIFVPAASFIFQWPLLVAVAGVSVWLPRRDEPDGRVDVAVVAMLVPVTFFWSNLAYTVFVMLGGQAPEVVAVAVTMPLLLALPLFARLGVPTVRRVGIGCAAASVAIAVVGGLAVRKSVDVPRPDLLQYSYEPQHKNAKWVTTEDKHDDFVTQRIPLGRRSKKADLYDLPQPITTTHSKDEDGARHSTLTVASVRHSRCIRIWELTHETITKARVNDKDVTDVVRFSPELDEKIVRLFAGPGEQSSWVMEYCGADEKGFKVDLFSAPGVPVKLRIIEITDGLPGPPLKPRAPSDGYPDPESDITMVMFDVTL